MRFVLIALTVIIATMLPWLVTESLSGRQARLEARMNALEEAFCNLPIAAPLAPVPDCLAPAPIFDDAENFIRIIPPGLGAANERE